MLAAVIQTTENEIVSALAGVPTIKAHALDMASDGYTEILRYFETIKEATCLISGEYITQTSGLLMLYAMALRRPLFMLDAPVFDDTCSLFIREHIQNNLSKIILCDLKQLDVDDKKNILNTIISQTQTTFNLDKHSRALVSYYVRDHLRRALIKA